MEENDLPELNTPEEIAGYLALKHANGMSFKQLLDLHTLILTRIGRDYVKVWGPNPDTPNDETWKTQQLYQPLKNGAFYVLNYLEDDDKWYDFGPKDDLTYE